MKRKKRDFNLWRIKVTKIAIVLFIGVLLGFAIDSFNDRYRFDFAIIKERYVSPVPNINKPTVIKINNTEPDIHVITPTAKPTATPTPKPKKRIGLVPVAYASEINAEDVQAHDEMIADYIKSKGWDYSIAIRVAKSENFWNKTKSFDCSRIGPMNKDGSYDYGLFQINTVHKATLEKMGMTMDDMLDCKKNIDFAFGHVYTTRKNWSAWSAFNNSSYLSHNEEV